MAIIASAKSSINPVSEGVHTAVCIWVIDLGEQYSEMFDKTQRKVMLTWEIPDETILQDGEEKPRVISREYTLSLSEKASLRQHLEAWRGKKFTDEELSAFDLIQILGKSCQIQVLHNTKGYANIGGIMSLPRGMAPLHPCNETVYFDLSDPACVGRLEKLPGWIQDKIKGSETWRELIRSNVDSGDSQEAELDSGDLPF